MPPTTRRNRPKRGFWIDEGIAALQICSVRYRCGAGRLSARYLCIGRYEFLSVFWGKLEVGEKIRSNNKIGFWKIRRRSGYRPREKKNGYGTPPRFRCRRRIGPGHGSVLAAWL